MANPVPEIMPDLALKAGAKIVGTGRSDFPNQINNVLVFPGLFRGALDVRASEINEEMKMAAAYALAERKRALTAEKADAQNRAVSRLSAGAVEGTVPEYFSPSEVRAMSPSEVRANYKKIMRSMEKWH
jgi:malic enzyme